MRPIRIRRRRALAVLLPTALVTTGLALMSSTAAAPLVNSTFEAKDGNLVIGPNPGPGAKDWINAPNFDPDAGLDQPTGATDDSFVQGTDEDTAVPTVGDGSIPPNKSDLTKFYIASETAGPDDDTFLYLGWLRVQDPGGTTNMDFELNQSAVTSSNGVTPVRTAGDILITYQLTNGGSVPRFGLHTWLTSGTAPCEASKKKPCWSRRVELNNPSDPNPKAEGSINAGGELEPFVPIASLSPRTFGEAAVNLTLAGLVEPGECAPFSRGYLKSRSSAEFNSALKDFIAPIDVNFSNCGRVDITKTGGADAVNAAGPLDGATFTLEDQGDGDTVVDFTCVTGGSNSDGSPPDDGECSFIDVPFATYTLDESGVPDGFTKAPGLPQTVVVSAQTPLVQLAFEDPRIKGRLDITKVDDDNPAVNLDGATFTLTLDGSDPPVSFSCTTGVASSDASVPAAGRCSFVDLPLGTYTLRETVTPPGHFTVADQTVTITAENLTQSLTLTDPRKFKVIVLVCTDKGTDSELYPSSVTIDGQSAGQSIGAGDLAGGLTESALCAITQGAAGDKRHTSDVAASVDIPQ